MRLGLFSDLVDVGYEILLEEGNIRLRYRKHGDPPEAVKSLIDELKLYKADVVDMLKADSKIGTPSGTSGTRPDMPTIWKKPHARGTPGSRCHSLEAVMDAVMISARNEIIAAYSGKQFRSNDEIDSVESMITEVYHKVLKGEAELREFKAIVRKWVTLCINEIN